MKKIIGIDVGGSTTKIVGFHENKMFSPLLVQANDPLASLYGAFGKFLNINNLELQHIEKVMITGVGSSFMNSNLYGIPLEKVDEFNAIGLGGLFLSSLASAVVVSMGTGTALVKSDNSGVVHLGGTGVGGGTILGLSKGMLNIHDFSTLIETAKAGSLAKVDLTIGDITQDIVKGLPPETTASNFGKLSDLASKADLALGILNLVFETIGVAAVFAARGHNIKDIVLTGSLTKVPQVEEIFKNLGQLFGATFHKPMHAEYATAIGAAITCTGVRNLD